MVRIHPHGAIRAATLARKIPSFAAFVPRLHVKGHVAANGQRLSSHEVLTFGLLRFTHIASVPAGTPACPCQPQPSWLTHDTVGYTALGALAIFRWQEGLVTTPQSPVRLGFRPSVHEVRRNPEGCLVRTGCDPSGEGIGETKRKEGEEGDCLCLRLVANAPITGFAPSPEGEGPDAIRRRCL